MDISKPIDLNSKISKQKGILLILSSPSGAGKTTLTKLLIDQDSTFILSISVTTRLPRPKEVDGQDYHFKSVDEFEKLVTEGAFLEYAKVFDHYYGTLKHPVKQALKEGKNVVFDIDWQGTQQIIQHNQNAVSVFILPPSIAELEKRLHLRAEDPLHIIEGRMKKAQDEISHWAEYEYIIINENLNESLNLLKTIIQAEKSKKVRQDGLQEFVKSLMKN